MTLFRKMQIVGRRFAYRARGRGMLRDGDIISVDPCYHVRGPLREGSLVVDCGTGFDANFSQAMIASFGARCVGFEPTRKHHESLDRIVEQTAGRFTYHKRAMAAAAGPLRFFESVASVSGSFMTGHIHVRRDETTTYHVATTSIDGIFELLNVERIDVLKLDIEGAEYEVLESVSHAALDRVGQLIVEFHDHCVPECTPGRTRAIIDRLRSAGFRVFGWDGIDFLFFRDGGEGAH